MHILISKQSSKDINNFIDKAVNKILELQQNNQDIIYNNSIKFIKHKKFWSFLPWVRIPILEQAKELSLKDINEKSLWSDYGMRYHINSVYIKELENFILNIESALSSDILVSINVPKILTNI